MFKSIKQYFCHHKYEFIHNIHGYEIIVRNWRRTLWCCYCRKAQYRKYLLFKDLK